MAEFSKLVITQKGQALIAKMLAGTATDIDFTKVTASDTPYSVEELEGLEGLTGIMQEAPISRKTRTNEVAVKVETAFSNTDLTVGYHMRTLGLYASDPDEGEILYAATVEVSGNCYMPPYNGITVSGAYIQLVTTVGNAGNVSLEVNPGAIATIGDIQHLQEQINGIEAFIGMGEAGGHITASVTDEKGVHGLRYANEELQVQDQDGKWKTAGSGAGAVSAHNEDENAHADIRLAVKNAQDAADKAAAAVSKIAYTIDVVPTQNGSKDPKTVTWTIGKAALTIPTQANSPTYTGNQQSPTWNNYDSGKMTLGGTTTGTNAGSYPATFVPGANYQWPDGTNGAKTVNWTIGKAAGSLTLDKSSLSLNVSSLTGTITVTRAGNGAISAVSSNSSAAAVNVDGNKITVTGKAAGSATITVSVAEGTNHTAPTNKTCAVTVTMPVATLNSNSWATIKEASDGGMGANYWSVGDTKSVTLNGKVGNFTFSNLAVNAFILGFNHNATREGGNRIHWQIGKISGKDIALCDNNYNSNQSSNGYFNMNPNNSNSGGWNGSYMRKTLLGNSGTPTSPPANSLLAALPSDLRAVMKSTTKYTDNTGGGSNTASYVTATTDYLFLLSEYEVHGTRSYANSAEQNYQLQYDYYKAGNSKIAYKHTDQSTAVNWWLRSPYYGSSYSFCNVGNNGNADDRNADWVIGVRPGFSV